jgi:hypothetical protein
MKVDLPARQQFSRKLSVMTLKPPVLIGGSFSREAPAVTVRRLEYKQGHRSVGNNSKPIAFRTITAAEFAPLSSSMQVTLLTIRRAQLSSRKAIAATAERKPRHGEF